MFNKSLKPAPLSPNVVALEGDFQHQYVHARGIRLHVATAGNPQDPLLLLLHDAYGGWFDFRHVLPLLADAGWYAVALDMRGYGMSDKPPNNYDHRHATGDISGVVRSLGHEKAHIFGAGSGASIAWLFASVYPEHVKSITTIGAIHPTGMRRAITLRPWLFGDTLSHTTYARLPRPIQRLWPGFQKSAVRRDLLKRTAKHWHNTPEFQTELELRLKARRIGSTRIAREKTVRFVVNVPPVSWAALKVQCPAFMLTDPSSQSHYFIKRAENRITGPLTSISIQTGRLPHIEAPEMFVSTLNRILRPVEKPQQ